MAGNTTISVGYTQDLSDWATIGVLSWLFLLGAPVNLSLFFGLTERLSSLSTKERLKLQLVVGDLLVLFVYAVSKVCWHLSFAWRGGTVLCKLVKFGHELSFQFSSAILAAIGLDRCANVLLPFPTPDQIKRRVTLLIYGAWIYAAAFASPQFYRFVLVPIPNTSMFQCTGRSLILTRSARDQRERMILQGLHILHLVTVFWLPLAIMIVSYAIISSYIWNLYRITRPGYRLASVDSVTGMARPTPSNWRRMWLRRGSGNTSQHTSQLLPNVNHPVQPNRDPVKPATLKNGAVSFHSTRETVLIGEGGEIVKTSSERVEEPSPQPPPRPDADATKKATRSTTLPVRTMKITLLLISSYIICWAPYHLTALLPYMFGEGVLGRGADLVFSFLIVLPSVINPWIYGFYTRPRHQNA